MSKTKQISITLDVDILEYLDELAAINNRSRSSMINLIISQEKEFDERLDEEAKEHEGKI